MKEKIIIDSSNDKNKANSFSNSSIAVELMSSCLGIAAEPLLEITKQFAAGSKSTKLSCTGLFKNVFELGVRGETQKLRLQIVDELDHVKAESITFLTINEGLALLKMLPLPLSPHAPPWLKARLGESSTAEHLPERRDNAKQGRLHSG